MATAPAPASVVVPREPTPEMLDAAGEVAGQHGLHVAWTSHVLAKPLYKAMLATAPRPSGDVEAADSLLTDEFAKERMGRHADLGRLMEATGVFNDGIASPAVLFDRCIERIATLEQERTARDAECKMNLDQKSLKVHGDCDATIASLRRQLAEAREKFTMHTAHVHAWFSALVQEMGIAGEGETVDVATACSKAMDLTSAAKSGLLEIIALCERPSLDPFQVPSHIYQSATEKTRHEIKAVAIRALSPPQSDKGEK